MPVNTGVNVSKAVAYAALDSLHTGESISKVVAYAVLDSLHTGESVSKAVAYVVLDANGAPSWGAFAPPNGGTGAAYNYSFTISGTAPATFALFSGSLPPGLSVSTLSGNTGQITGIPTTAGTYSFSLLATNSAGVMDSPVVTLTILAQRGNIDYDQVRVSARQGGGSRFQMFGAGSTVSGHAAVFDAAGNIVDGGGAPVVGTGALTLPIRVVTSNYSMTASDYTVVANAVSITITLPAAPALGQVVNVKNANSSVGQLITVAASGANKIDDLTSLALDAYAAVALQWDGLQWREL